MIIKWATFQSYISILEDRISKSPWSMGIVGNHGHITSISKPIVVQLDWNARSRKSLRSRAFTILCTKTWPYPLCHFLVVQQLNSFQPTRLMNIPNMIWMRLDWDVHYSWGPKPSWSCIQATFSGSSSLRSNAFHQPIRSRSGDRTWTFWWQHNLVSLLIWGW